MLCATRIDVRTRKVNYPTAEQEKPKVPDEDATLCKLAVGESQTWAVSST